VTATTNVLAADVFGTGIFQRHFVPEKGASLILCASLFLRLAPLPLPASYKIWELYCMRACLVACVSNGMIKKNEG
jgi:hypothetical protein